MMFWLPLLLAISAHPFSSLDCNGIAGAEPLISDHALQWIVVGEVHGTEEAPKIFTDLVCLAKAKGRNVVVALEQPRQSQSALDAYLRSDGGTAARATLTSSGNWHASMQDGRTSIAYLEAIERLRLMVKAGQLEKVVAFQPPTNMAGSGESYEKAMAATIEASATAPDTLVVVLVGNLHARTQQIARSGGKSYRPMASFLPTERTRTLNVSGNGGSSWSCMASTQSNLQGQVSCSAHAIQAPSKSYPRGIVSITDPTAPYSAYLNVGAPFTASPPAIAHK